VLSCLKLANYFRKAQKMLWKMKIKIKPSGVELGIELGIEISEIG
jgi:hypothetical protein